MAAGSRQFGKRVFVLASLGLLLASLPGCQSITINASSQANLRIVDASPDAPGLDFYDNTAGLAYNIGFGTASTYVPLQPGAYTVTADQAGTRQVLTSTGASLYAGREYTAIVGNTLSNLQSTILQDQAQAAPSGEVSVRVLNWATRSGAVDVYLVPSNATLATTAIFASNVAFEGNTGYINIPANTYGIAVVPAGTVPSSTTVALLNGAQQYYNSGSAKTVVLMDNPVVTTPGVRAVILPDFDSPTQS